VGYFFKSELGLRGLSENSLRTCVRSSKERPWASSPFLRSLPRIIVGASLAISDSTSSIRLSLVHYFQLEGIVNLDSANIEYISVTLETSHWLKSPTVVNLD